jgi:hypothetical protein
LSTNPWIWIAAFLTLCIFSFLYRDNPFYRFAEYLFVGISLGWSFAIYWHNAIIPRIWIPLKVEHDYSVLVPLLLGSMVLSLLTKKHAWLIRWPIAFYVGAYSGLAIPPSFQTYIFKQLQGTMLTTLTIGGVVIFVGVVTTLLYFYFSREDKGILGRTAGVGIWFIMAGFGAAFGYTVMARISLLIGRVQFLLHDWLGVIQ